VLTLTDDAVQAIRDLMVGEDLPQDAGMRIASVESDPGSLELSLTSGPQTGDEVISREDVRVFLAPDAAIVSDKTLDAELGTPGRPAFRLTHQTS
jgi:iron-sulfur cluster assembly protein